MYVAADKKEMVTDMLLQALKCADSAELLCDGDRDFVAAIARTRIEARRKLVEAGLQHLAAPPSTLSAALSDLPSPIPPILASALLLLDPPPPFPPLILSSARRIFLRLRPPLPSKTATLPLPPPFPSYPNHLLRSHMRWPRCSDGRPLTPAEFVVHIMSDCDFIAHAHAFVKRWLKQLLQPGSRPQLLHVSVAGKPCRIPSLNKMQAVATSGDVKEGGKVAVRLSDGKSINVRGSHLVFEGGAVAVDIKGQWMLPRQLKTEGRAAQRPLRLLHDASTGKGKGGACMRAAAAARVRVRCSEVAFLSVRFATCAEVRQVAGSKPRMWTASIVERVFSGYCKRVQVRWLGDVVGCIAGNGGVCARSALD